MIYTTTLYDRPFNNLISGKKSKELRVDKPKYKDIHKGDVVFFKNAQVDSDFRMVEVLVSGVYTYSSLDIAAKFHDPSLILPEAKTAQDLEQALLRYYSLDVLKQFGVVIWDISIVAVHLQPIKQL